MSLGDADAFKGYSVGAVDYIMKPFVPEIIRSKVSVFIDLFNKSDEIKRQAEVIRLIEQREYQAKLEETTERMQAETEQARAEHRAVRAMVQNAPMGFARLSNSKTVTDLNPVFAEHYGLPDGNVIGKKLEELIPWLPEPFLAAISANQPFHSHQMMLQSEEDLGETHQRFFDLDTADREFQWHQKRYHYCFGGCLGTCAS